MSEIIRAEIVGRNYVCEGFRASGLPELCRKLIEAGYDPAIRLEAFRGEMLCLTARSIGEAAELEIAGSGVGFCRVGGGAVGRASLVSDQPRPVGAEPSEQKSRPRACTPRSSARRP
jgi:hypothetical protein